MPQALEVAKGTRFVDSFQPLLITDGDLSPQEAIGGQPTGQARPLPILGPLYQLGPQRVALHIPDDRNAMVVILERERLIRPCQTWPVPPLWRLFRRACVIRSHCIQRAGTPSSSGLITKWKWLGVRQYPCRR